MMTTLDIDILEGFTCLEPEVGADLLPFYPDLLDAEQKAQFELHLEGCELCRERWKLWAATGFTVRLHTLLQRAQTLLADRRYEEAIALYNRIFALQSTLMEPLAEQEFFQPGAWLSLTAARSKDFDLMPYLAPSYAPDTYTLAAAQSHSPFPLTLEYADGKIKANVSTAGRRLFFEPLEVCDEFQEGFLLLGKIRTPVPMLRAWNVVPGQKLRLGTLRELFATDQIADIIAALKSFKVYPA